MEGANIYTETTLCYLDATQQIRLMMHMQMLPAFVEKSQLSVFSFKNKKWGTRSLTYDDVELLLELYRQQGHQYGFKAETLDRLTAAADRFTQLRQEAYQRLSVLPISLQKLAELLDIRYQELNRRKENANLWTPLDILTIGKMFDALSDYFYQNRISKLIPEMLTVNQQTTYRQQMEQLVQYRTSQLSQFDNNTNL